MILTGVLFAFLLPFAVVSSQNIEAEVPLVEASETSSEVEHVSNLLPKNEELDDLSLIPETRGRSDIEIEEEAAEQPPQGYFYPKPSKPFDLPAFKTLQSDASLDESVVFNPGFEEGGEMERLPRSPQKPQNFLPPTNSPIRRPIRPLPLYFRPIRF